MTVLKLLMHRTRWTTLVRHFFTSLLVNGSPTFMAVSIRGKWRLSVSSTCTRCKSIIFLFSILRAILSRLTRVKCLCVFCWEFKRKDWVATPFVELRDLINSNNNKYIEKRERNFWMLWCRGAKKTWLVGIQVRSADRWDTNARS